jgi:lipopolysaccharide export system permease protein
MKLLDRYIIRQFIVTSAFALLAVTVIFVVIDALEHLEDFIDKQATIGIVALYYLYFIPEIIKLIMPVAMLLGSLFVTARMSTQCELTAIKSSGVSLYRIMTPYLLVAFIISALAVYFNGWVVPQANKKKFTLERVYLQKEVIANYSANIYFQDSPTRILSIGYFDESRNTATRVSIQDFDPRDATVLVGRVDASSMVWDSTARGWILSKGTQRTFRDGKEVARTFITSPAGRLRFNPDDLRKKQEKPDEMDYYTMRDFIRSQQQAGQDVARWQVDFYSKISFPFASVIVVLFAVPFSSIKRRGGMGVQVGISLLICFIYLIFMKVSQVFGYNGDIHPLLTAWLANIFFLGAASYVLMRVPK